MEAQQAEVQALYGVLADSRLHARRQEAVEQRSGAG